MSLSRLLIANRGEIAIRIARAASSLSIKSVAVYAQDDAQSLHVRRADAAHALPGNGVRAYLDIDAMLAAARAAGCDAIHPGYGFLAENAEFARRCAEAGILFVGPSPELLGLFGDKAQARALAQRLDVPVIPGTGRVTLEEARAFMASQGPDAAIMIKAVAGGGGRGMRAVLDGRDLDEAWRRCESEALAAFGNGALYVERLMSMARHIEVQIIADGQGGVSHLWERECTLQRRNQKLVEIAPSPWLAPALRDRIIADAIAMACATRYASLATLEFLVDLHGGERGAYAFIEANPRLQVEHTVTEEVTGIDLVRAQLAIAGGATLDELGLTQEAIATPKAYAIQCRVNVESMTPDGQAMPAAGTIATYEVPGGPGVRVDGYGYTGYTIHPGFDSLLAKVVASGPRLDDAWARAVAALDEFRLDGVDSNLDFLRALLRHPEAAAGRIDTRFIERHGRELVAAMAEARRSLPQTALPYAAAQAAQQHGAAQTHGAQHVPPHTTPVVATMPGRVVSIDVNVGDVMRPGQQVAVLEAMKMEHLVHAAFGGIVRLLAAGIGDMLSAGDALCHVEPAQQDSVDALVEEEADPDAIRTDLREALERHAIGLDAARPDAVARRRKTGQRTARENLADLCDADSLHEYGALALAAQRRRRPMDELLRISPADGLVSGIASVNGDLFDEERARCMVLAYDYTVMAGTQGMMNHKKTDRMLRLAEQWRLPVIFFTEGGGGRPGDTDALLVAGLDCTSFAAYARLSGLVPRIGIVSGRCFAGNAAFLGCSDVIIATNNATIGMGGPAMIEGGGLGVYAPEEVGPVAMQSPNGVIDIVVADEAEAVRVAKQYLSYFQGPIADWQCADQRLLRHAVPENRSRVYDMRRVMELLADAGSVLELRREFGVGILTALVRIEGRPLGLIANNPAHLGGAIDADAADKAARFMQLCDAFDLPIVSLCDTPGFMVGPQAEATGMVRHVSRMFVTAASVTVPFYTVVLRKGYGLGAQSMAAGSFGAPFFTIAWPSAEFGAMGIEGSIRLGYRKELEAIADPDERERQFRIMVDKAYETGKAINMASYLEIDDVIDPAETRGWILRGLKSVPKPAPREGKKRGFIDTW
ncbi:carboxyl transferase domain-containing protein [Noviherbaspirillum pedocola]|uniref:Carbamoyl-phosphate synthase large subunit n=1 Tax=Noviherbaspirillum pedocola TaxID=2801341 RepID=A0A934W0Q0_9BURK|nr:carboxyl transferase domain-containing protein [Noviherbaspirillum pedocola]MBK4734351.1 carbamoyl-phosphate synthase large subunit [Noviherbaspirillum pedocola]